MYENLGALVPDQNARAALFFAGDEACRDLVRCHGQTTELEQVGDVGVRRGAECERGAAEPLSVRICRQNAESDACGTVGQEAEALVEGPCVACAREAKVLDTSPFRL